MTFESYLYSNQIETVKINSFNELREGELVYVLGDKDGIDINQPGVIRKIGSLYALVEVYYLDSNKKELLNLSYFEMEKFFLKEEQYDKE